MTTAHKFRLLPLLLSFACAPRASAQEIAAEHLARVQAEAALVKAEAEIASSRASMAKSRADTVTANFPTNKVTPLDGTATVSDFAFPPQLLAYSASEQMISSVTAKLCAVIGRKAKGARVLVYQAGDSLTSSRAAYRQLVARTGDINTSLVKLQGEFGLAQVRIQQLPGPAKAAARYIEDAKNALAGPKPSPAAPSVGPNVFMHTEGMSFIGGLQTANEGITAINSTLQSVLQLIALFRTNTDIKGTSITLDVDALLAQYAHALQNSGSGIRVEYPSLMVVDDSPLLSAVGTMAGNASLLATRPAEIDVMVGGLGTREKEVEEQIKSQLPLGTPPSEELKNQQGLALDLAQKEYQALAVAVLPDLKQRITNSVSLATTLDKSLQTADDKTGVAPLSAIVKLEAAMLALAQPNAYSLLVKVVNGGGATKTDRNLFTGTKITHLGGAVFITTLVSNAGRVLYTDVSKGFLGYSKLASTGGIVRQDLR
jgi:hypothetical protein